MNERENIYKQYERGIITAEEAVQKTLSAMNNDLGKLCEISNDAIFQFNYEVTGLIACLARTQDPKTGICAANETLTKDQVMERLCAAYELRDARFRKLWDTLSSHPH